MRTPSALFAVTTSVLVLACGPQGRSNDGNGTDAGDVTPPDGFEVPLGPEICDDAYDNDRDGRADCGDVDCSGVGSCPVCGQVDVPEATPLLLPDGVGSGAACTTDADCGIAEPNCVFDDGVGECHEVYTSALDFIGFPSGATLTDPNQLLKVCLNIEHSYIRDLQIELVPPSGVPLVLHEFVAQSGSGTFLGEPDHSESNAVYGTGWEYCWTPTASATMIQTADSYIGSSIPAGDYRSFDPWTNLTGTPLNGRWAILVTDAWPIDNGFLFGWRIEFDPSLVVDCAGPIIE